MPSQAADRLLQTCMNQAGVNARVKDFRQDLMLIRRAVAVGEQTGGFGDDRIEAARLFEAALLSGELIDFDAMVLRTLDLIRSSPAVRQVLAARFPWLVIDEYQDLGGPLHAIVTTLNREVGVRVFAVGGPHQSINGHAGADPRYLEALAAEPTFQRVTLKFNYRSGNRLIRVAQAALSLDAPLPYAAHPGRTDLGEVSVLNLGGDIEGRMQVVVDRILPVLRAGGVPLHEVAILYRGRGRVPDAVAAALTRAGIPFIAGRDERVPRGADHHLAP